MFLTSETHLLDKIIFTNPGPATEVDSMMSEGGRFLATAWGQ